MKRFCCVAPLPRLLLVVVLALCLGVRLLTPIGFMPSFAGGSLAIVECPQAEGAPVAAAMPDMPGTDMPGMAMPHGREHDAGKGFHQTCPYAEAASLAGTETIIALVALLVPLAALAPLARLLHAVARRASRDRPPSRGPPLPA
jgi:hypothetical protein